MGLSEEMAATLAALDSPENIQDFVSSIPINFEPEGDTCFSVQETLRQNRAHCIEGAFVAACALWMQGRAPLLMDFQARGDDDHVIALFKHGKNWGAISKSNHIWLRWRDPVHRTLRELAMSYFHEYVSGQSKSMRNYSRSFNLSRFSPTMWVTNTDPCWDVAGALDSTRHYSLISDKQARRLRPRDHLELRAGELCQFKAPSSDAALKY